MDPFCIYPNPVRDCINLPCDESDHTVQIFRNNGSRIHSNIHIRNFVIKVSDLPKGYYFMVLENKTGRRVAQFVKI